MTRIRLERELPFRFFSADTFEVEIQKSNENLRQIKHDKTCYLWHIVNEGEREQKKQNNSRYIASVTQFNHKRQQAGGTCLSTCLAILVNGLTGGKRTFDDSQIIEEIRLKVNTGAPRTWSEFLHLNTNGYRLAYCNTDHRKLKYYKDELLNEDDLFLISWYSKGDQHRIDTNDDGSIGGSHVVILWKDQIIDTNKDKSYEFNEYMELTGNLERSVKRIFRVVAPWSIHRL